MSSTFRVRRARLRDLDRILEIERASFGRHAYDRKLFADYWRKCGGLFLVACGDQITAEMRRRGDKTSEVNRVAGNGLFYRMGAAEGAEVRDFAETSRTGGIWAYMISCTRGNTAELVSVAVDPQARRTGAGSALMDGTLRRLRRRGVRRVVLMVRVGNRGARRFYDGYGFREVRLVPGYYEDGADGWLMELRISSHARSM
jgi:ribosomal-protein-alanine N-acetyltransferase